jgi:uncharacterized protein YidB (DUF937 family)
MGLLDSVIGAAASAMGGQQQQQPGAGGLGGLGAAGGLGALLPVVVGMLGNNGQQGGGLGDLIGKFQQAGMGDMIGSWVGKGDNMPISADQIGQVLGGDTLGQIASQLGVDPNAAAGQLSDLLPGIIDKLTPNGEAPSGGLGNAADLMGMLGGLLGKR